MMMMMMGEGQNKEKHQQQQQKQKRISIGLILIVIVCTSQVGSAFTSKIAVQNLNVGPFFLMWIHTLMMILMYPLGRLWLFSLLLINSTSTSTSMSTSTRQPQAAAAAAAQARHQNQHQNMIQPKRMFYIIIILFYPLWIIANYCYIAALQYVSASIMVSIFGSCTAFVSILERILLNNNKSCSTIRIIAVLLAVFGVISYGFIMNGMSTGTTTTNNNNNSMIGVLLGTLSSISAAMYKVSFKKILGNPTSIDVCLFLSILGIVNLVIGIIPFFILSITGIEKIPSLFNNHDESISITYQLWIILGGSILILIFNSSIAFGIAITSPLFIAIGTALAIPVTDIIDYYFVNVNTSDNDNDNGNDNNDSTVSFGGPGQIIASISIIASFVLMTFDQYSLILGGGGGGGDGVGDGAGVADDNFAVTTGATTTMGGHHHNGSDEELRLMIIVDIDEDEDEYEDNILPRSTTLS
jgi:solute carrier family 35 protein F3/4